jgi:hypothetical protein
MVIICALHKGSPCMTGMQFLVSARRYIVRRRQGMSSERMPAAGIQAKKEGLEKSRALLGVKVI